jgi:Glycosyl transferase family 2
MDTPTADLPLVSALFITYKRFDHLQRAVESFRRNTKYPRLEIVIADDGSGADIQEKIRQLRADAIALAPKNVGLGANNNAGLRLCRGKYVLMIQDDWNCYGPPEYLTEAVRVMEANPELGLINFASVLHPPDLSMRLAGSIEPCYVTPKPCYNSRKEEYLYSDQPHLQSMESLRTVGFYCEDRDMERSEQDYVERWKAQVQFRTAVFPGYHQKVFRCDVTAVSHRTTKFRYRIQRPLIPVAHWLKQNCRPLYRASKVTYGSFIRLLGGLRVIR